MRGIVDPILDLALGLWSYDGSRAPGSGRVLFV
jgi:hypothetical protein